MAEERMQRQCPLCGMGLRHTSGFGYDRFACGSVTASFGERALRRISDECQLHQQLNVARNAVQKWGAMRREPKVATLPDGGYLYMQQICDFTVAMLALANALGIKEEQIIGEKDDKAV